MSEYGCVNQNFNDWLEKKIRKIHYTDTHSCMMREDNSMLNEVNKYIEPANNI